MNHIQKNILIVEDERLIARDIKRMVEPKHHVVGIAKTYEEAVDFLKTKFIDLVLLDVNLIGEKTGVDLAHFINDNYKIPFIYLTAQTSDQSLVAIKETHPAAFISKPIMEINVVTTIDIVLANAKKKTKTLVVGKQTHVIDVEELIFAKSDHVYLELFFLREKKVIRYSLSKFLEQFDDVLIQVNRSTAINPQMILSIKGKEVSINDYTFLVSEKYLENLKIKLSVLN